MPVTHDFLVTSGETTEAFHGRLRKIAKERGVVVVARWVTGTT